MNFTSIYHHPDALPIARSALRRMNDEGFPYCAFYWDQPHHAWGVSFFSNRSVPDRALSAIYTEKLLSDFLMLKGELHRV